MKELKDLIQDFDSIQELPISEESLGAYMEGHLAGAELRDIQNILNSDDDFFHRFKSIEESSHDMNRIISVSESEVDIPSVLNANEIGQTLSDVGRILNDTDFAFSNGDSIFDVDYNIIDAGINTISHHEGFNPLSQDSELYNRTHDDILTNTKDPSI